MGRSGNIYMERFTSETLSAILIPNGDWVNSR